MLIHRSIAAVAAGCLITVGAAALAQSGKGDAPAEAGFQAVVLEELKNLDWITKSEVAALREGVVQDIELKIGMEVKKGNMIGTLHHEIAELTVAKNELQAKSVGPTEKAKAQRDVAIAVVARNTRLNQKKPGMVSDEEVQKAEGELNVATAQLLEATENHDIAVAELNLANQTLKEHTIVAPFDGMILKVHKHPGESVRANEPVVALADPFKLSVDPYVPLEYAYRVKVGQVVEIQPRITYPHSTPLPIEKKKFRGKITFVHPEVQTIGETGVRVRAEFDNPNFELNPGLMVKITIFVPEVPAEGGKPPERTAKAE